MNTASQARTTSLLGLLLFLGATACGGPSEEAAALACDSARSALTSQDFQAWTGIPDHCTARQLFPVDTVIANLPEHLAGTARVPTAFRMVTVPGYQRLRVGDAGGRVLIDGRLAGSDGTTDDLVAALGAPRARLDVAWKDTVLAKSEWVWPKKGLAVVVVDGAPAHAVFFSPTTLTEYESSLRPSHAKSLPASQLARGWGSL